MTLENLIEVAHANDDERKMRVEGCYYGELFNGCIVDAPYRILQYKVTDICAENNMLMVSVMDDGNTSSSLF